MVDAGWSDRLDSLLRSNVEDQYRGLSTVLKKPLRWDSVAKQIPGMSAEQCQARWTALRALPGVEHKGHLSLLPNSHTARFGGSLQVRRGSPGLGTRPPAAPGARPATGAAATSAVGTSGGGDAGGEFGGQSGGGTEGGHMVGGGCGDAGAHAS